MITLVLFPSNHTENLFSSNRKEFLINFPNFLPILSENLTAVPSFNDPMANFKTSSGRCVLYGVPSRPPNTGMPFAFHTYSMTEGSSCITILIPNTWPFARQWLFGPVRVHQPIESSLHGIRLLATKEVVQIQALRLRAARPARSERLIFQVHKYISYGDEIIPLLND